MIRIVFPLSFIIASRFFGLFIILPVLSLYASKLDGGDNDFLLGLLIGVYALAQMILQIPFGILSDKIGRKKTLLLGLVIFIIGSFFCAIANDIYTMIFGRILQGSGAIGAVASALISDLIKEEQRSKAMAIMGGFIGLAFAFSMVLSPIISDKFGFSSLFWLSLIITIICIILLYTCIPKENKIIYQKNKIDKNLLFDKNLLLMDLTNFLQKCLMNIIFFIIPIFLINKFNFTKENLWIIYTIAMIFGFLAMGLAGAIGEKKGLSKAILLFGIIFFMITYIFIFFSSFFDNNNIAFYFFVIAIFIFFIGFNLHEPIMQSCASKFARVYERGLALGVFNACGYAGSFVGGILIGIFIKDFDILAILLIFIIFIWFVLLFLLKNPSDFKNIYLNLDFNLNISKLQELKNKNTIIEFYQTSKNLVIKYDIKITNSKYIQKYIMD